MIGRRPRELAAEDVTLSPARYRATARAGGGEGMPGEISVGATKLVLLIQKFPALAAVEISGQHKPPAYHHGSYAGEPW